MSLDVFRSSAFSTLSLTDAVNKMPFVPGRLGELGLFDEHGIRTTSIMLERKNGRLTLIPASNRGGPAHQNAKDLRDAVRLSTIHLAVEDTIPADEFQDVRAFGQENQLQTIQGEILERQMPIFSKFDATLEHLRIGAVKGKVMDADGSTELVDLFSEFDITQPTAIDFDLDNASPDSGAVRKKCSEVIRKIEDALGNASYQGIHSMCSSQFFDDLVDHPECREAYQRWNNGQPLFERTARRTFFYGGIMFEEYRGSVNGVKFIADGDAQFFPVGSIGLFRTAFAPADFVETANTVGLPRYSKVATDPEFQRWVKLHSQSNPLPYCTRPEVLHRGTRT